MHQDNLGPLLAPKSVAEHLGISRPTLWRLVRSGEFPHALRVGGQPRWSRAQLDAYLSKKGSETDRAVTRARELYETTSPSASQVELARAELL